MVGLSGWSGRRPGLAGAWRTYLGGALGQQFIVENRPGASSNIATEYAARAPKDGYTLFLGTVANVVNAAVSSNLPFDFSKDFAPIALAATVAGGAGGASIDRREQRGRS